MCKCHKEIKMIGISLLAGTANISTDASKYMPDKPAFKPAKEKAPPEPPQTVKLNFPRLSLGLEYASVGPLPASVRTAHAYRRPETVYSLPETTGGWLMTYEIGAEIAFLNFMASAVDIIYRDSYTKPYYGRVVSDVWSEREDSSGERLGYRLHGWSSRLSLLAKVFDLGTYRFMLRGGYIAEAGKLSSGTDAWASFHDQHSISLPSKVYGGLTLRGCPLDKYTTSIDQCQGFAEFEFGFTLPLHDQPAENGLRVVSIGLLLQAYSF